MTSKNHRLAIQLASTSDAFDEDDDPEDVIRAVLKAQIDALKSREEAAEQKRASLQEDILGCSLTDTKDEYEGLSETERKQAELRRMILED